MKSKTKDGFSGHGFYFYNQHCKPYPACPFAVELNVTIELTSFFQDVLRSFQLGVLIIFLLSLNCFCQILLKVGCL